MAWIWSLSAGSCLESSPSFNTHTRAGLCFRYHDKASVMLRWKSPFSPCDYDNKMYKMSSKTTFGKCHSASILPPVHLSPLTTATCIKWWIVPPFTPGSCNLSLKQFWEKHLASIEPSAHFSQQSSDFITFVVPKVCTVFDCNFFHFSAANDGNTSQNTLTALTSLNI